MIGQNSLPDSLSLQAFLQLAVEQSIDKYISQTELEVAELNYQLFQASLRPQITADANFPNYQRTNSEIIQPNGTIRFQPVRNNNSSLGVNITQNIPQTGGAIFLRTNLQRFDDFETNDLFYNGIPFRLGLVQPLFGFNAFQWDRKIEPLRLTEAYKRYQSDVAAIRSEATQLFFDVLQARTELNIAVSNRFSNQELYDISRERHALGKISDSDLIQLQVNLISAQRSERNAQQNLSNRSAALMNYLGRPSEETTINPKTPERTPVFEVDEAQAIQQAIANRVEVSQFDRQILEAERRVAEAKRNGGFQADLVASFGLTRSAQDIEEIYRDPQQEQLIQVQLSVPLLDWGRQKNTVGLQQKRLALVQQQVKQNEISLRTNVLQTVQAFLNLQQEVQLAKELQILAQKRFDIARDSYRLGAINVTDLIFSQQEKDLALRTYILVLGDYWLSFYRLQQLTLFDFETNQPLTF